MKAIQTITRCLATVATVAITAMAAACQPGSSLATDSNPTGEPDSMTDKRDTTPTRPTPTRVPASGEQPAAGISKAVPAALIDGARADLATRAQVAVDDIEVRTAQQVTWRDGSMGCPEPGMAYTMALVPGYRVVLRSGGKDYAYHAGANAPARLCENPSAEGIAPSGAGGQSAE
ncbi:MAG: hypothetical protein AAFN78_10125 [Pseudomonadota bacterium]